MTLKTLFFGLILLAVAFEAAADVLFKSWSGNARAAFLILGMILYAVGTFVWAYSLKYEFLSKAISVFTVLNLIVIVLIGVFFFKEELTPWNVAGIILGIASVSLLSF